MDFAQGEPKLPLQLVLNRLCGDSMPRLQWILLKRVAGHGLESRKVRHDYENRAIKPPRTAPEQPAHLLRVLAVYTVVPAGLILQSPNGEQQPLEIVRGCRRSTCAQRRLRSKSGKPHFAGARPSRAGCRI